MSPSTACLFVLAASLFSTTALAVPRAYVASYGSDANTATSCGPTTPCRTFTAAMSVADTGGQVIVLDSAGYGSVVITKSISLIAPNGIYAGLTGAPGGTAVDIATAGVDVVLKGLTITGQGSGRGIYMTNGKSLHMESTTIAGFSFGSALVVQAAAKVNVVDSVIRGNSYGIYVGNGATMSISGSQVLNHTNEGIVIRTTTAATGATTAVTVSDSVVAGALYCVDNWEISGNTGALHATNVTASDCAYWAFTNESNESGNMTLTACTATRSGTGFRNGAGTMTVGGSSASGNTWGFYRSGGTFESMGNNTVRGNTTNTYGTITPAALQ